MRKMLLSFKPSVYNKLVAGTKIYEHRKVFPDEPIMAYLYVSYPVCAITGILILGKRHRLVDWKIQYADDADAVKRIDDYLKTQNYAMEIEQFEETSIIPLQELRENLSKFVVPQMYYYLDDKSELMQYIHQRITKTGKIITHQFEQITSQDVCLN